MPLPRHLRPGLSRAELDKLPGDQLRARIEYLERLTAGQRVPLQEEDGQAEIDRLTRGLHLHLATEPGSVPPREADPPAAPTESPEMRRLSRGLHEALGN